jgi:hypothetical protein
MQCATETGVPLHWVPVISQLTKGNVASLKLCYCVLQANKLCEGGPATVAVINLFGLGPVDALCRSVTRRGTASRSEHSKLSV